VESGAELLGYSGFSGSNYLSRANDADYNSFGNGEVHMSIWFKSDGVGGLEYLTTIGNAAQSRRMYIRFGADGTVQSAHQGDTTTHVTVNSTGTYDDGAWHKADLVRKSNVLIELYVDGVLIGSSATDAGSLTTTMLKSVGIGTDESSSPGLTAVVALDRLSGTAPTATQVRQMYDAEKGMFVASAECLLQSGSTDAVIDVDVDPLTSKVLVTQTDAITIFDGLVVDSKPTVNSGSSEKGKLWGDLRAEQNSANAYVTAPAVDQRQVNEMVRGLASELPAGVDLSKAKAWIIFQGTGTIAIEASYNVKSIVDVSTGRYEIHFAVPFKSENYAALGSDSNTTAQGFTQFPTGAQFFNQIQIDCVDHAGSFQDQRHVYALFFGELENE